MRNAQRTWERRFLALVVVGQAVIWLRAPQVSLADHLQQARVCPPTGQLRRARQQPAGLPRPPPPACVPQAIFLFLPLLLLASTFRHDYAR